MIVLVQKQIVDIGNLVNGQMADQFTLISLIRPVNPINNHKVYKK